MRGMNESHLQFSLRERGKRGQTIHPGRLLLTTKDTKEHKGRPRDYAFVSFVVSEFTSLPRRLAFHFRNGGER